MGRGRRRRIEPTDDWDLLVPLFEWPEQQDYEELRPVTLFGASVAERATEMGTPERTLYRRIERFERDGMLSLFPTDPAAARAKRRGLEPTIRRMIVELKAEHPRLNNNEIAYIVYVRTGRRLGKHTPGRVLSEEGYPPFWRGCTSSPSLASSSVRQPAFSARVHNTLYERRQEIPGLEMVGLVHDEVLLLVPEEHADRAAGWLTDIMEAAADTIVNVDAPAEARVPMEADTKVCGAWADQRLKTNERSSKDMRDKWRDEDAEAEYEWEDEYVNLQLYSDHRRGDLDSYPIIVVCDDCAAELGGELGGCAGPAAGDILFCEECGISVDNAPDVT